MLQAEAVRARPRVGAARRRLTLAAGLAVLALVLLLVLGLSLALGARSMSLGTVLQALVNADPNSNDHSVVLDQRLPRTLIGLAVGIALGLAGAIMQGITRNPIADPGLLGVNAGSALFVVVAITWFGVGSTEGYVWFALGGAAIAAVLVYGIGMAGRGGATPARVALVGAAVTAAATSLVSLVLVTNVETLNQYRFWVVGSLVGRDLDTLAVLLPFLVTGALMAVVVTRDLNVLALGDDVARGLGQRLGRARAAAGAAVVLLCGSATALAGPIVFVGLVVPHAARLVTGPDQRWIAAYSALLGPILLLTADVIGRLVAQPGELEVGLVVAFIGAPLMIAIVRRSRLAAL
jgi:iron complex transport system permease protein